MTLDRNSRDAAANDLVGNWCEGTTTYDASGENTGTPGTLNPSCP